MKKIILLFTILTLTLLTSCQKRWNFKPEFVVSVKYSNASDQKLDTLEIKEILESRLSLTDCYYRFQFTDNEMINIFFAEKVNVLEVEKYLESTANIEFWETYKNTDIGNQLFEITNEVLSKNLYPGFLDSINNETEQKTNFSNDELDVFKKSYPLSAYLNPNANTEALWNEGPILGYAKIKDTAIINEYLSYKFVQDALPVRDLKFMWDNQLISNVTNEEPLIYLYLIKNSKSGKPELDGSEVSEAREDFDPISKHPMVFIQFSKIGSLIWADITERSANESSGIAITLDNKVFSAPIASTRIEDGMTQITGGSFDGMFGLQEAKFVASILNLKQSSVTFEVIASQNLTKND